MDFKKLTTRFRQFGGLRLVWQYAMMGVIPSVIRGFFRCLFKRQSFKGIYPEVLRRVEPLLVAKYGKRVQEFKRSNDNLNHNANYEHSKVIWWCWLQGLEKAPAIVKACYASLERCLVQGVQGSRVQGGYQIKVIDAENWKEYVELPEYIVRKWEKGRIPAALFSDLLRLELLIKYGGTWIDSTVLCTGLNDKGSLREKSEDNLTQNSSKSRIGELKNESAASKISKDSELANDSKLSTLNSQLKQYMEAPLFLFQYTPKGTAEGISVSNWFISAHSNNVVLMAVRDMLHAYWKEYSCTLDYYMLHLFFAIVGKEFPEQVAAMPHGQSQHSLVIMHHLGDKFKAENWNKLVSQVCFHKLAFRVNNKIKEDKDNYYNKIISLYSK